MSLEILETIVDKRLHHNPKFIDVVYDFIQTGTVQPKLYTTPMDNGESPDQQLLTGIPTGLPTGVLTGIPITC